LKYGDERHVDYHITDTSAKLEKDVACTETDDTNIPP
jgi:hypothetical protein